MNLILLGAPGAGKGTQGELISQKLQIPTISTGQMLREALANGSALGKKVKDYMDSGSLVPDEIIIDLILDRVAQDDCKNGFILDGVPRTLSQAEVMDQKGVVIDYVVSLEVSDDAITGRMSGRRVCSGCGATFHVVSNPSKTEGVCDHCGEKLMIRKDDQPETVKHRLEVYHAITEVLKDYYAAQNKLRLVSGDQSIEDIHNEILVAIGNKV